MRKLLSTLVELVLGAIAVALMALWLIVIATPDRSNPMRIPPPTENFGAN